MLSSISASEASSASASQASSESKTELGTTNSKGGGTEMAANGQGRSTLPTHSVTGTYVKTIFQLPRTCVVIKGDATHSAMQVTKSAFIVRSLLSTLECFGNSPSWIFRQRSMWRRLSLSRNQAPMLGLMTLSPILLTWRGGARPKKKGHATK